jgi:hypothetical protein
MSQKVGDPDSGAASILCDPDRAPIEYHWYQKADENPMEARFVELIESEPITEVDRANFIGSFRGHMRKASQGRLLPLGMVAGPMRTEQRLEIFEIRWRLEYGEEEEFRIRAYHAEPSKFQGVHGSTVVGLHIHKKSEEDDSEAAQDAEIKIAADRFFEGRPTRWGLSEG